jgi:hypothetical protein
VDWLSGCYTQDSLYFMDRAWVVVIHRIHCTSHIAPSGWTAWVVVIHRIHCTSHIAPCEWTAWVVVIHRIHCTSYIAPSGWTAWVIVIHRIHCTSHIAPGGWTAAFYPHAHTEVHFSSSLRYERVVSWKRVSNIMVKHVWAEKPYNSSPTNGQWLVQ